MEEVIVYKNLPDVLYIIFLSIASDVGEKNLCIPTLTSGGERYNTSSPSLSDLGNTERYH